MQRICLIRPFRNTFSFSSSSAYSNIFPIPSNDISNLLNSFNPPSQTHVEPILSKLSNLTPYSLYNQLDSFYQEALLYISQDAGMGLGFGMGVVLMSAGIKLSLIPMNIAMQKQALKMKLIEPEIKQFQDTMQMLQKKRDFKGIRAAREVFNQMRIEHNLGGMAPFLGLMQLPIIFTWFITLRYYTTLPDKYPELTTQGLFWFKDLTSCDPYFMLPLISALTSYCNISLSPNINSQSNVMMAKMAKYFKFMPFLSLPITIFFPSGLALYWCIMASLQLCLTLAFRSPIFKNMLGIPKFLPGTILEKMVFYQYQNQRQQQNVIKAVISDNEVNQNAIKVFTNKPKKNK